MSIRKFEKIRNGNDSLYALIIEKDPLIVQLFEPTVRSGVYRLNDLKFELLTEDFVWKMEEPELIPVGRSRGNYYFE